MAWQSESKLSKEKWFEQYVSTALETPAHILPPSTQKVGKTVVVWEEIDPGVAWIRSRIGTAAERSFAEWVVKQQLEMAGYKRAQFTFDHDFSERTADWDAIMEKAQRLMGGNVQILRNGYNNIVAQVQGDHGSYQSEIGRDDPNSRVITTWQCECNNPHNLIVMANGSTKEVQYIQTGDKVLTATGHVGIVGRTMNRDYDGRMIGLKIEGSTEKIWLTDNHKLVTTDFMPKEAGDWKTGDYSYMPQPQFVSQYQISVSEFVEGLVEYEDKLYLPNKGYQSTRQRKGTWTTTPYSTRQKPIPARIALDENFARIAGLFVAEGIATSRGELRWSFSQDEQYLADEIIERLKVYGLDNAKKKNARSCTTVAIQSKPLSELFKALFGTGSRTKKLAMPIMTMNKEALQIFFDAWVEGDGCTSRPYRNYLGTASDTLAMQARLILAILEKESVVRRIENNVSELVPNGGSFNQIVWRKNGGRGHGARWFENEQVNQRMIVEEEHYVGKVYNFEVLGEHSYVLAPGIASFNCPWDQYAWQRTRKWKKYEGRPCHLPESIITLADGTYKAIENIKPGDQVITHKGSNQVTQDMVRQYRGRVYSIYRAGFPHPIRVTENHEIWAKKTSDKIRNAKYNVNIRNNQGFKINDDSFIGEEPEWIDAQNLQVNDWIASTYVSDEIKSPGTAWATVLGYYIAEGNLARGSRTQDWSEVQWTFHKNEVDLHQELYSALRKLGYENYRIYFPKDRNCISIRVSSVELAFWLYQLGGHLASLKTLNGKVLRWSKNDLEALVDAWAKGDGDLKKDGRQAINTSSPYLARQLYDILVKCGYIPSWTVQQNNGGPQNRQGRTPINRITFKWTKKNKTNGRRKYENHYMSKIVKIEEEWYEGPVYNLSVANDESYVAEGVTNHNCAHVLAAYWKAQSMPLDDDPNQQQGQLFNPGLGQTPPGGQSPGSPGGPPSQQMQIPGIDPGTATGTPPVAPGQIPGQPAPDLLPEFPQAPKPPPPVSIPGGKAPSPLNPVQYPGGTFSSWKLGTNQNYWHITKDPNFQIDPNKIPSDLMSSSGPDPDASPGLMVTQDPHYWASVLHSHPEELGTEYENDTPRQYAAQIDLSNVPSHEHWPVNRGGSDERWVNRPDLAQVRRVIPLQHALNQQDEWDRTEDQHWLHNRSSWNFDKLADVNQDLLNDRSQWGNLQVRLKSPQYGIMQGKSEEHGAGQYKEIPANSIGTLMEVDPSTGWCSVIFAGPQSTAGPMQPYHVSAWLEASELTPMMNVKPPGPFVKRRSDHAQIDQWITTNDGYTFAVVDVTESDVLGVEYIVRSDLDGNDMSRSDGQENVDWQYVYIPASEARITTNQERLA